MNRPSRGYTFVELLATIAVLVIVFGLVISLANFVRNASATDLTASVLHKLDDELQQYSQRFHGQFPPVTAFNPQAGQLDGPSMMSVARQNNTDFVRALGSQTNLAATVFADTPSSVYDPNAQTLRDAWGSPIIFMPHMHPQIGMALLDRPFFFSAGPDRKYLTREDNLYSYETVEK